MKPQISIGTDIIDIQRFRDKPLKTNQKFYNSNFSKSELKHCTKFSDPYPHLSGIFAAKEATIKCLNKPISMSNIETFWDEMGKPYITVNQEKIKIEVSISHTQSLAIAVVLMLI